MSTACLSIQYTNIKTSYGNNNNY